MAALPSNDVTIDALDFARKALEIHDTIAVSQFSLLAEYLNVPDGALEYRLAGCIDEDRKHGLELGINGRLLLTCQRCLGPMPFDVDVHTKFVIVRDEASIPETEDEDDTVDYLVAESQMSVMALVEDELLLSLPLAPKHDAAVCGMADKLAESGKVSPFAELEKLKTQGR